MIVTFACLSILMGTACQRESAEGAAGSPASRMTETITFAESLDKEWVSSRGYDLGSVWRMALQGRHRKEMAPRTAFDSDPFEVGAKDDLLISMSMLSLGQTIPEDDRPHFEVELIGPNGSRSLLGLTGQVDFPVDEWSRYRIALPTDLGSPLRLRLSVSPAASPDRLAGVALPLWGIPRVIRSSETSRPNVLFVVLDTLRADHTQPYGYERETTPFLSRLVEQGALVEEAVATYPTTLSSHWSMFTGLFPARHGVYPGIGHREVPSNALASHFQGSGYRTAAFTEGGFVHTIFGFGHGFDHYYNGPRKEITDLSGSAAITFDLALDWLTEAKEEPYFVFLHTYQVHTPYEPSEPYRKQFANDYGGRWATGYGGLATFAINNGQIEPTDEEKTHLVDLYDAEIRELDALFEKLWNDLESRGILENTIVAITSDHGEDLFEHGWLNHGTTLHDPALLVPLIFIAPGRVAADARLACQSSGTDIMPTLLGLAGLPIPEDLDGRSLREELETGTCSTDSLAFSELLSAPYEKLEDLPIASLRKDGWKLIRHVASGHLDAYDLSADPEEKRSTSDGDFEDLESRLDRYVESRPDYVVEESDEVPEEVRERLKALGYVE